LKGVGFMSVNGTGHAVSTSDLPSPLQRASKIDIHFCAGHEHLALYMQPLAIMRKLNAMTGGGFGDNLVLAPSEVPRRETRLLGHLINLMVSEVDDTERPVSPLVIRELEQYGIMAFLVSHAHNYSHLFATAPKPQALWQLRRAEEYIEANWDRPLSIEALAGTLNVSMRSIYYSFKETRGYSPMAFLKQVRLRHAKDMLSCPDEATSVTSVAYTCGFGNLGHFAKNYFQVYGEYPSDTLKNAKGKKR
jgi:AraC-like DNA-binding protein